VLSGAKTVLEVGKSALEVFPVPGLTPVADVLIALITRVEEVRTTQEGLEGLSREISQLVIAIESTRKKTQTRIDQYPTNDPRYRALEDGLRRSQLSDRVAELCGQLNRLRTQADDLYKGPFFLRCFHSSRDAGTLTELQTGVANALQYFSVECQVAIEALVNDVLQNLAVVEEKVEEVKVPQVANEVLSSVDDKVLEGLPHADASYRASVNTLKSNFLPGTRSELFMELDAWVEGRPDLSSKAICILTGGAGTGKSTIALEFARRLDECGSYGASFFFVRGVADLSSTRLFFPTIAYQLAHAQDALRQPVINAAREHLKRGKHQQMKYEAESLVQQPVSQVDSRHPAVFLVVDAVDECTDHTSELVPKLLRILMSSVHHAPFPLRVFLTSRPEHVVEHTLLKNSADVHRISLHNLSPQSVARDVSIFVRDRLSQTASGATLLDKQPDIVDRLAQRADGLFVYARTAMDFLDSYPDHFEERLDELLGDGSSVPDVPLGPLDDLYLTVLETAFPPRYMERQNALRARVDAILGCIALLRDHLSPRTLEALTRIPCADSVSVLYQLQSVVLFDREKKADEAFRPMHASFPQFLVDPARCTNPLYAVDARRQHARLAEGCLRVLTSLERNTIKLEDATVPVAEVRDLAERVAEHVPPHVRYACVHWAAHLAKAEKAAGLGRVLGEFAAGRMLVWLETLGYLGRLDVAKVALASARDWQEVRIRRGMTRELLDEGRQLVVDHYAEIEECPGDVYRSAIRQDGCSPIERGFGSSLVDRNGNRVSL
ncbi:hypothetical protein LXA43DRAFT_1122898, partial [Ganoderma leucocontextum]